MPSRDAGWRGLVDARFGGDEELAKAWVADLGRIAYFNATKPYLALHFFEKWASTFPHLAVWSECGEYPIKVVIGH